MVTKKQVQKVLDQIPDPEIGISIVQLGLIYGIAIKGGNVRILMTLTSVGCPLYDQIAGPIRDLVLKIKGVKRVDIDLTFEPPWSIDNVSAEAKMQLGY
jgi:metal-sulfur cluster biosynthetic enzyme